MRRARPERFGAGMDPTIVVAAAVTVAAAWGSVRLGAEASLGAILVAAAFAGMVLAFATAPHVAVVLTLVLFTLVPTLQVFITPAVGAAKDLVVVAAACAAVTVGVVERHAVDRWVGALVLLILGLYAINLGGGHDVAWAHGIRLVGEPLLLLLSGMVLPQPRRTLRFAVGTLVVMACGVAVYGILQQAAGPARLVGWGYDYNDEVRFIGGRLRSFGTFEEPFAYAAFLIFGLGAVLFGMRRSPWSAVAFALLLAGLTFSYVRTVLVVCVAFAGLVLVRRGLPRSGLLVAAAAAITGIVVLSTQVTGTESRSVTLPVAGGAQMQTSRPGVGDLVLNGRVSAWRAAVGDEPGQWVFGPGVGEVGTAAARAGYTIAPAGSRPSSDTTAVDSGYLATVADVGIVGLGVLLALLGRLLLLATRAARRGDGAGWVALALLSGLVLDAVTRASLTGFPTAFVSLLVVGVALAAARSHVHGAAAPALRS